MRIHTNTLTAEDIRDAARQADIRTAHYRIPGGCACGLIRLGATDAEHAAHVTALVDSIAVHAAHASALIARKAAFAARMAELSPAHATECQPGACGCPDDLFYQAIQLSWLDVPAVR